MFGLESPVGSIRFWSLHLLALRVSVAQSIACSLCRFGGAELHPLAAGPRPECVAAPVSCPNNKYRTLDGSCNNLRRPAWGMAGTRYARLVPAKYADGKRVDVAMRLVAGRTWIYPTLVLSFKSSTRMVAPRSPYC